MMKLITWNMARNSVGRSNDVHDAAWKYLTSVPFDLAFLQEARIPAWARDRWTVVAPSVRYWGSAVLAARSIDLSELDGRRSSLLDRHGYLAWARLTTRASGSFVVGSVHAPVGEALPDDLDGRDPASVTRPFHLQQGRGPYRTDAAYAIARELTSGSRFLVAGDWNVSRLWDERYGITECHEFFHRAAADGWVELTFRDAEWRTWYRDPEPAYQMDHVFADPITFRLVKAVEVDPRPAADLRVSDHAPLMIDISL